LQQRSEMSLKASQYQSQPPSDTSTINQADEDKQQQAAIRAAIRGHCMSLQETQVDACNKRLPDDYIPPTSVEAERAFSAVGILCSKLRSSVGDRTL